MVKPKIVVLSGAGISAESGLPTFRDDGGLWRGRRPEEVATPTAWAENPQMVLDFYNMRRKLVRDAQPNAAHRALVDLEAKFDVRIVTQNIDDLHERAGSSSVLHLHGEILKARSEVDPSMLVDLGEDDIEVGDLAPDGRQLRPDVVWFGETVPRLQQAAERMMEAELVMVVGTSLTVYPAAGLLRYASQAGRIIVVTKWLDREVPGVEWIKRDASEALPAVVEELMN